MKNRKTIAQLVAILILVAQLLGAVPAAYAQEPDPAAQQEEPAATNGADEENMLPDEEKDAEKEETPAQDEAESAKPALLSEVEEEASIEDAPAMLAEDNTWTDLRNFNNFSDLFPQDLLYYETGAGKGNVIGRTYNAKRMTSVVIAVDAAKTYSFQVTNAGQLSVGLLSTGMVRTAESGWVAKGTPLGTIGGGSSGTITGTANGTFQVSGASYLVLNIVIDGKNPNNTNTHVENGGYRVQCEEGAKFQALSDEELYSRFGFIMLYSGNSRRTSDLDEKQISSTTTTSAKIPLRSGVPYVLSVDSNNSAGSRLKLTVLARKNDESVVSLSFDAQTYAPIELTDISYLYLVIKVTDSSGNSIAYTANDTFPREIMDAITIRVNRSFTVRVRDEGGVFGTDGIALTVDGDRFSLPVELSFGDAQYAVQSYVVGGESKAPGETLTLTEDLAITAVLAPTASMIKMANLSLDGTIKLNLYALLDGVTDLSANPYMVFEVPGSDGNGRTVTVNVNPSDTMESGGKTYYRFTLPLAAKQMADEVKASLWDDSGWISKKITYSVQIYCQSMINKENNTPGSTTAGLVPMLYALLDYGTAAQNAFNYRTGTPANGILAANSVYITARENCLSTFGASDAFAAQVSGEGVSLSANLNLEEEVTLNVLIQKTDAGSSTSGLVLQVSGKEVPFEEYNDDYYCAKITGITAPKLKNLYTFRAVKNGQPISREYRFGPFSYAKLVLADSTSSSALKQLMESMAAYHYLAWDYLKAKYPDSYRD